MVEKKLGLCSTIEKKNQDIKYFSDCYHLESPTCHVIRPPFVFLFFPSIMSLQSERFEMSKIQGESKRFLNLAVAAQGMTMNKTTTLAAVSAAG